MSGSFVADSPQVSSFPTRDRGIGYWRNLDWLLLISAIALTFFGSVLVWSASRADLASETDPQSYLKRHLINIAIALVLGYIASRLNYRWLRAYTPVLYGASLVLLLLRLFTSGFG